MVRISNRLKNVCLLLRGVINYYFFCHGKKLKEKFVQFLLKLRGAQGSGVCKYPTFYLGSPQKFYFEFFP